uniref:Maelstrom domain-containing protein n=1 Tax=Caenorhabditis tropicalis TaxID=1561998 RepID=A0A1I7TUI0_9PELO
MDHNWFYGPGRLDQTIENDRNEFYELSRISDISNEEGDSPCDVFYWMHAELEREPYATIVCDKWQFNYVYYGLKLLATYTGHNAMNFFKERIASRMLPIQDFTVNLLEVSPLNKPRDERWSEESIEKQFKFNRIIARNDLNSYCSFHERFGTPTRHYCCMAQATRLLHNFFRILRANRLQGFDYSPPVHDLCIEEQDPRLPPVLESPMFTRAYLESQDEEEEENHGYEGGDERPETPDHYDFEEGDGSDDDDEDDGRGVYRVNAMVPRHDEDQSRFISRSTHYPIYPADNYRDVPSPAPRRRYEEDEARPLDKLRPLLLLHHVPRRRYTEHHHPSNWEMPEIFDVIPREDAARYWRIARRPPKEFRLIDLRIDD